MLNFRYYVGGGLLWGVLSESARMLEDMRNPGLVDRRGEGFEPSAAFSDWVFHEVLFSDDAPPGGDFVWGDPMLVEWADRVQAAAAGIGEAVDSDTVLYYLATRWKLRVLIEFDRLARSFDSPEVRQRCRASRGLFDKYTAWLRSEIALLEENEDIGGEGMRALGAAANPLMDQLAAEWSESVERLNKEVPILLETWTPESVKDIRRAQ